VIDLALVGDRDGLETAVRVPAHAALFVRRPEIRGAGVIEEQERRQLRAEVLIAEHGAHREAVAHPMGFTGAVNAAHVLRGVVHGSFQSVFHGVSWCLSPNMGDI